MLKRFIIFLCLLVTRLRANIILGVDLGSDYFKMNLLKPGKSFTMVENLQSKTKTTAGVAFKDDERLYGSEALIRKQRFPKQALTYLDRFLGEEFGNEEVTEYMKRHYVSYDIEEDEERKTYNFRLKYKGEDYIVSPEEHFGMIFRYIKLLAEKFCDSKVYELVVSVPNSWGYKKRHSLSQSVRLAGLQLKGVINQNTAAAVHYMTERSFNETTYHIFYNMGSSYTQASLVSLFSRYETDKKNKTTEHREINVIAETWDENLGGRDFDFKLVDIMMDLYDKSEAKKGQKSVKGEYKIAEKLLPNAIKYKEILSSNKEVGVNVLGVETGINLLGMLYKKDFEENSAELFDRVYKPIENLLKISGVPKESISAVELIGGGIRIPKIQEILREQLGENVVGTHMNGDDSVAFGTAYIFANSTKYFKVTKKIYINNGPSYEVKINIDPYTQKTNYTEICSEETDSENLAVDCTRNVNKNTTLFKLRHGSDVTRTVTFKHDSDIQIKVYESMEMSQLEERNTDKLLMTFYVTNFDEVKQQMINDRVRTLPKTHLRFKSNEIGLITLSAEVSYEVDLYFNRIKGENDTVDYQYTADFTDALDNGQLEEEYEALKAQNRNDTEKIYTKIKNIGKTKKQEKKINLNVERVFTYPRPLNKTEFEVSKKKLDAIDEYEREREKNMEARNNLETDIYGKREFLDSENIKIYAKPEEIEEVTDVIRNVSNWYDDEGYNANTTSLVERHNEIKNAIRPIETRIMKHEKRENAYEDIEKELKSAKREAQKLVYNKDWLKAHYDSTFSIEVTKIESWFVEKKNDQAEKPLHEDPIVSYEQIHSKIKIIKKEFNKLKNLPKPKTVEENKDDKEVEQDRLKRKEDLEELLKKMKDNGGDYDGLSEEEKDKLKKIYVSV